MKHMTPQLRICVIELRFILKPHHLRWRCTSSIPKESNFFVEETFPTWTSFSFSNHLDIVFENRCSFSEVIQSRTSLLFKISVSKTSIPLSRQELSTGAKWQGKKLVCIIGLAKSKGFLGVSQPSFDTLPPLFHKSVGH